MKEKTSSDRTDHNGDETEPKAVNDVPYADQIEYYAGRHISSRHGRIHWWLCIVYLVLFVWALYYGVTHWGGLGPGLDY